MLSDLPVFNGFLEFGSLDVFECEGDAAFIDAIYAFRFLLEEASREHPERCDTIFCHLLACIYSHGGKNIEINQISDLIYECWTFLFLARKVQGISFPPEFKDGVPDIFFSVLFHSCSVESRIHIECKNIRETSEDVRDLARKVISKIENAYTQVRRRQDVDDWVVFIDLPVSFIFGFNRDIKEYIRLGFNVLHHFEQSDSPWFDSARVFYTATFQSKMHTATLDSASAPSILLPPIVSTEFYMGSARTLFSHSLFTEPGKAINILNFGKAAIRVDDPENWLF